MFPPALILGAHTDSPPASSSITTFAPSLDTFEDNSDAFENSHFSSRDLLVQPLLRDPFIVDSPALRPYYLSLQMAVAC